MDQWDGIVKPLNCEAEDMSSEWQLWKEQLRRWLNIKGIKAKNKMSSYLVLLGGMELQKICLNLQVGEQEEDDFEVLIAKLDGFFIQPRSLRFERHVFRLIMQKEGEKFDAFVLRLRRQALKCGWTLWMSNENIADQIVAGCQSDKLRTKIMEKDTELEEIIALARSLESVELQGTLFRSKDPKKVAPELVGNVEVKREMGRKSNVDLICFSCGRRNHIASSADCPAKGRSCNRCGKPGHFEVRCMAQKNTKSNKRTMDSGRNNPVKKGRGESQKQWSAVNEVKEQEIESENEEEILGLFHLGGVDKIKCVVGGVEVEMVIDSGAAVNVIGEDDWYRMEKGGINMLAKTTEPKKKLTGYGADKPLELLVGFVSEIQTAGQNIKATFYVVKNGKNSLLGNKTAKMLGVLRVGSDIEEIGKVDVAGGFPKLKGFVVKLNIDEKVPPVFQPYRRVPISLEDKVEARIKELIQKDIVEKVKGYSRWASPLVVVPKKDGEIRVCVDLRRPNTAILYENVPFMTTEELMPKLEGACVFSKIDGKDSYYQVELEETSREITTFIFKGN